MRKLKCLRTRTVPLVMSMALAIAGTCPVLAEGLPKMSGGEAAAGRIESEAFDEAIAGGIGAAEESGFVENADFAEASEYGGAYASVPGGCGVLNDAAEFSGNCMYSISDGVLTISGKGDMGDMVHRSPWKDQVNSIRNIVIEPGVEYIGNFAFRSLPNIESVTVPSTVKKVGSFAFWDCENLKEVNIDASLIGESAFINCRKLESVTIGKNVTAIGVSAFEGCVSLKKVYISDLAKWCGIVFGGNKANPLENVVYSKDNHFYLNGKEITDLDIPEGVTEISDFAFDCAKHIRSVNIPDSVKIIGEYAFHNNPALEVVTGASAVTEIGARAFEADGKLSQMPFSDSLNYVGSYAFHGAPIRSFAMKSGEIAKYAFYACGNLDAEHIRLGDKVKIGENAFQTKKGQPEIVASNVRDSRQQVKIGHWGNQDIEWTVLDVKDGIARLISKDVLQFIEYQRYVNPKDSKNTWSGSFLRTWLNGDFYKEAFSDAEKSSIVNTVIYDDDNPIFGTKGGSSSEDKLYILSATELLECFNNNQERMAARIPAAHTVDGNPAEEDDLLGTSYYWVRTPGMFDYSQSYVHYTGRILYDGQSKSNLIVGVRPVMRVNASTYDIVDKDALEKEREEKIKGFVTRLYRLCLDREPDASGFSAWVNALMNGDASASKVVRNFFFSQEMEKLNLSDSVFLDRCYLVMVNREPDSEGKASWLEVLSNGVTKQYIIKRFVKSEEFTKICNNYGVTVGELKLTDIRDRSYGITSYVARCYTKALGRKYDVNGLKNWVASIFDASNTWERAKSVAKDFLNSVEFKNKNLDNTEFCKVLYRVYLDREADEKGLAGWVASLENGTDRNKVIDGFADSQEFTKLLEKYLGTRKPG